MGLIVDGTWKGEFYDQEQMPAQKVAKIFGIHGEIFPKKTKQSIQFELHKSKRKIVRGQQRIVKQIQIPTQFTKSSGGDTVTIIYFDKKVQKRDPEGRITSQLTPRKLILDRKVVSYKIDKYADTVVYLALHNQCHTSPLANLTDEKSWGLKDHAKEAEVYLYNKRIENTLRNKIFTDPIELLRMRAKGINIANVDNMDDEAVRASILQKMENAISGRSNENFEAFNNKFNAPYSGIKGYVQECMDRAHIKRRVATGGKYVYFWRKGLTITGDIVTIPRGKEPKEFLVDHIVGQWETYRKHILDAIKYGTDMNNDSVADFEQDVVKEKAIKPVKEMSIQDICDEAIKTAIVMYNPVTKGIHLVSSKTKKLEKDPFMAVDLQTWAEELRHELSENSELLKKVKQKLNGKRLKMPSKN